MKSFRHHEGHGRGRIRLAAAALATALAFGVSDASAQFFDRLFGLEEPRRQRQRVQPPPPPVQPPPAPRVEAPSYYDYRADPLVRVDFRAVAEAHAARLERADEGDLTTGSISEPDPAAASAPGDAFAEELASLSAYELFAEKDIADALVKRYSAEPRFIWVSDLQGELRPGPRAEAALAVLREAASHGLNAEDYALPELDLGGRARAGEEARAALARFEVALSARVLRYVRDAHRGRVDPNRLSGFHDFAEKPLDYAHVLSVLSDAFEIALYLESWHPRNDAYGALRAELAELQKAGESAIVVDPGTFVRPGGATSEFAKLLAIIDRDADEELRARFGDLIAAHAGSETYAQELTPLIRAVQESHGLNPDAVIGPRTVAAVAGDSRADRMVKVKVALEQLRWLPSKFGDRHVFINVPAFNATYVEGGQQRLSMRTVVGNTRTQTHFFQDEIQYVEFHPYWGVPRSILVNTYLPRLYQDPSYLDRMGFEVTDRNGQRVASAAVDWPSHGARPPFDVRQPPGPTNALGRMKIMFPNRHAIYMHDTPERHLFARDNRAYSNGCVRLEDPEAMTAAVLGWSRAQVDERLRGDHGRANLDIRVPVYVAYFTAWPDAAGTVAYSPDVYDRDSRVLTAMDRTEAVRAPGA